MDKKLKKLVMGMTTAEMETLMRERLRLDLAAAEKELRKHQAEVDRLRAMLNQSGTLLGDTDRKPPQPAGQTLAQAIMCQLQQDPGGLSLGELLEALHDSDFDLNQYKNPKHTVAVICGRSKAITKNKAGLYVAAK